MGKNPPGLRVACARIGRDYKPGSPAPEGFESWAEWCQVQQQIEQGQQPCARCGRWLYPIECSEKTVLRVGRTNDGHRITLTGALCHDCATSSAG